MNRVQRNIHATIRRSRAARQEAGMALSQAGFRKQYAVSLGRFFGRRSKREGGLRSRLRRRRQVAAQKNPAAGSGNHLAVATDDLAAIEGAAL
jgi:hypothetical protein